MYKTLLCIQQIVLKGIAILQLLSMVVCYKFMIEALWLLYILIEMILCLLTMTWVTSIRINYHNMSPTLCITLQLLFLFSGGELIIRKKLVIMTMLTIIIVISKIIMYISLLYRGELNQSWFIDTINNFCTGIMLEFLHIS